MRKFRGIVLLIMGLFMIRVLFSDRLAQETLAQKLQFPLIPGFLIFFGIQSFRKKIEIEPFYASTLKRAGAILVETILFLFIFYTGQTILLRNSYLLFASFTVLLFPAVSLLNLYLLTQYGADIGKLIVGIRVKKTDGKDIGFKEALLRMSVSIGFLILITLSYITIYSRIPSDEYMGLGFGERNKMFLQFTFPFFIVINALQQYWMWSELAVMTTNRKRRAIHDFIAGTIVVNNRTDMGKNR